MTDATPARFTLRQLPLPAKLVLSCFLVAVGLGYFSALVQLHLQHSSRNGEPMPGVADVVERFAGKKKADPSLAGAKPVSRIEKLITAPMNLPFNGGGSMAPAFFDRDGGEYKRLVKDNPAGKDVLDADRRGEQLALQAWIKSPDDERKRAYEADAFVLPEELIGKPITNDYQAKNGGAVKVKTLIGDRCVRCHGIGQAQADFPLETYAQITRHATVPPVEAAVNGWVRSERQMSVEKLTQSTHAHLLSFAVLFTLTGLVFALTDWWVSVRMVFAPWVLVFQVIDVSLWWLARIDGPGPYFAMGIILTGGLVAIGLLVQIVGGLLGMYGPKGKAVVILLLLLGFAGLGAVFQLAIAPALQAQKDAQAAEPKAEAAKPANGNGAKVRDVAPMPRPAGAAGVAAAVPASQLDRVIATPHEGKEWNGGENGSMAAAFFHKDGAGYAKKLKDNPGLKDEREGERQALLAWVRTAEAARKAAYDADAFPLPAERVGKPITADYVDGGKVKVKSLLAERCARCHVGGADAEEFPLETYEQLLKYLGPEKK